MLADLVLLQPKTSLASEGGKTHEEIVEDIASQLLNECPKQFDEAAIVNRYPILYEQSMNTVLIQEVIR